MSPIFLATALESARQAANNLDGVRRILYHLDYHGDQLTAKKEIGQLRQIDRMLSEAMAESQMLQGRIVERIETLNNNSKEI
jgi:hypothetical protein